MTTLRALKQDWEWLGQKDPLWAVCTDPRRQNGRWELTEFFATGEAEIQTVMEHLAALNLVPDLKQSALDFGCGAGRLTRALSMRFDTCVGVDISSTMIGAARQLNQDRNNCKFLVNESERLAEFSSGSIGFIYSSIVLQHIEPQYVVSYLREFARLLKPDGVLVFQMPSHRKVWMSYARERLQLVSRLRRLWELFGIVPPDPRNRMRMNCLDERTIRQVLLSARCTVRQVSLTNSCDPDFNGSLHYLAKEPDAGYISKQYVALRTP
jgi:SAM-dependent methyltransferase